jgi:hypothetical protein
MEVQSFGSEFPIPIMRLNGELSEAPPYFSVAHQREMGIERSMGMALAMEELAGGIGCSLSYRVTSKRCQLGVG